jgi:dTMP kinase
MRRAYRGGGQGVPPATIRTLAQRVHDELWPDLTLLLDVAPEVGLARAGRRGAADRFERERLEFFERVRAVYLELAREAPGRIAVIDAARPATDVARAVEARVGRLLTEHAK